MGNIPADMALLLLIEKSASNDDELSNHFDIYDICSKKTGPLQLKLLTAYLIFALSIRSLRKRRASF